VRVARGACVGGRRVPGLWCARTILRCLRCQRPDRAARRWLLRALLAVALPLGAGGAGGAGGGFRDSQQTLWGARQDAMAGAEGIAEARTAPLFFKAAVPKPVRVVPSFLGDGRPARGLRACCAADGLSQAHARWSWGALAARARR